MFKVIIHQRSGEKLNLEAVQVMAKTFMQGFLMWPVVSALSCKVNLNIAVEFPHSITILLELPLDSSIPQIKEALTNILNDQGYYRTVYIGCIQNNREEKVFVEDVKPLANPQEIFMCKDFPCFLPPSFITHDLLLNCIDTEVRSKSNRLKSVLEKCALKMDDFSVENLAKAWRRAAANLGVEALLLLRNFGVNPNQADDTPEKN